MGSESGVATTNNSLDLAVPAFLGGTGGAGTGVSVYFGQIVTEVGPFSA